MTDDIQRTLEDGVLTLRIDRPAKKNALTAEMYTCLADGFAESADNETSSVRTVVLEGGDDMFSAGNDLQGFLSADLSPEAKPPVWRFIDAVIDCPVPVVAAVTGPAIGIGATILLHCDLVFAHRDAYLHMPFTDLAAVPEAGASYILPRRFGPQIAGDMLLLARKMSAARAAGFGLVNEITEADPRPVAQEAARALAAKPPQALRRAKSLMRGDVDTLKAHIETEMREFAACLRSDEMQAVIARMMARK